MATEEIDNLMRQAASLSASGAAARKRGEESEAASCFRQGLGFALEAARRAADCAPQPARLEILWATVLLALNCGEAAEARELIEEALTADPSVRHRDDWAHVIHTAAWSDEWLIAAVRRDPPDVAALDVLAERYWKPLFGRCQTLTLNRESASDLAQQAWLRVLRARHTLKPGGNFPAFLATVATNIWRDSHRSARRAGPMADHRLASLDAASPTDDGGSVILADTLPDLKTLRAAEEKLLAIDIDQALAHLTPLLRDVMVSRLLGGESCAEIGRRYDRTEQTISAWVRQATREVRQHLETGEYAALRRNAP